MTHLHHLLLSRRDVLGGSAALMAAAAAGTTALGMAAPSSAQVESQAGSKGASQKTLCQHLADYVASLRFEAIPREVIEKAKQVFLHNIAVAFGGVGTDEGRKALDFITSRQGVATVIGQPFKAAPMDAALANSVFARALHMEDLIIPSTIHAGAVLMPAALALAEQHRCSGKEVLTALVAGCDVLGKVAGSLWTLDHSNRSTSHIFGALGVAALAARLMRLDAEQTAGALAYACDLGAMIAGGFQNFQYGLLTHNGMLAARLGQSRAPFPLDALEGPDGLYAVQLHGARPTTEEIIGSLGERYEILTTVLKPHPCSGINLVPIELVRQQMRQLGLAGAHVRRIKVARRRGIANIWGIHGRGPFEGPAAISSLPFALGALLVDGEITPAHFTNPNDPRILKAMERIVIELRDDLPVIEHEVEIETVAGQTTRARGDARVLPLPDAGKLLSTYGDPIVGAAKTKQLRESVAALEQATDILTITRCLA